MDSGHLPRRDGAARRLTHMSDSSADVRLEFRDVTKKFQDRQGSGQTIIAVEGVTLSVRDGEVVSLIGPSGCGKSTLLNMASGLNGTSGGEVIQFPRAVRWWVSCRWFVLPRASAAAVGGSGRRRRWQRW